MQRYFALVHAHAVHELRTFTSHGSMDGFMSSTKSLQDMLQSIGASSYHGKRALEYWCNKKDCYICRKSLILDSNSVNKAFEMVNGRKVN